MNRPPPPAAHQVEESRGRGVEQNDGPPPRLLDSFDERQRVLASVYDRLRRLFLWSFRIGAAILVAGVILALVRGEALTTSAQPFRAILPAVLAGRAAGVIDLAIVWFIATPIAATLVVAVGFARAGDRRYAAVSLLVLAVLGATVVLAASR